MSAPLHGDYFDGVTAAAAPVTVTLDAGGTLRIRGAALERRAAFSECTVSPELGRTPRIINLPGGAMIETTDLGVLAEWELSYSGRGPARLRQTLESRWRYALLAAAVLVLVSLAAYVWGIPIAARWIAFAIPSQVNARIGQETLSTFERLFDLRPSGLPAGRQAELRREFERMAGELGGADFDYVLEIRHAPGLGPNAFALPSGTILLTDELVGLAERDEEVLAVLAHEITHVERRHGMRSVLQNSGVFLLLGMALGDLASATSLGASVPTILAKAGYSRDFEREADRGAAEYSRARGWGTAPLRAMLERLGRDRPREVGASWVSSHPEVEERLAALEH